MFRTLIRTTILDNLDDLEEDNFIPAAKWYGSGAVPDVPERPFAEIRSGGRFQAMSDVRRSRVEVWIHDEEGDFGRIEAVLAFLKRVLDGAEHLSDGAGTEIMSCVWINDSTDLYDDGYRTNCMSSTFEIVGKEPR